MTCLLSRLALLAVSTITFGALLSAAQTAAPVPPQRPQVASGRSADLSGSVLELGTSAPLPATRVTAFTPSLSFFRETRSDANGDYAFTNLPSGALQIGFARRGYGYQEVSVVLSSGPNALDAVLETESEIGQWNVIGDTLPEVFDATDIGVLLPSGWVMYCHDTTDPILFNPTTGEKLLPPESGSEQGCMNSTLLTDGSVLIVGGSDGVAPGDFVNGIPWVKRFAPPSSWSDPPDLLHAAGRWYPGMARLADGSLLVMGGGQSPDASRTETCERLDLTTMTWSYTDSLENPLEFPPAALLYTGEVLQTWGGQPELYDPVSGTWSTTGNFVSPNRGYPGHSDHSLLVLSDGRAIAVGINAVTQPSGAMVEAYDPVLGQWSIVSSPDLRRFQSEVVYLPDGAVFVGGGDQGFQGGPEADVLGIVRRCDLFDPATGDWRRIADMNEHREYHAVTLLLPDGRVTTTGGTYIKFAAGPTSSDIEAYSPPYLFRGVRPQLSDLTDATPNRGQEISINVFPATRLTSVVIMGMQSTTHWVDCGIPRRLELDVTQQGSQASVILPSDADALPLGWYLLFGMVDDIPSVALPMRVLP